MKSLFSITVKKINASRFKMQLAIVVFILVLSGCASLPDLSGYTAATDQLRQSIKSAGDSVTTEIDMVSFTFKESGGNTETIQKLEKAKKDFQKYWEYRNKAMTAVVGYAASLEEITNAGNEGKESVKALGDSIEGLLGTIGIVPGAQVVGVAKETIELIYSEVAKVKAQKHLDESLRETGLVMQKIIEVIEKDTEGMKSSFEIALNAQILQLQRNSEPVRVGGERDDLITLRTYRNKALIEELKRPDDQNHSKIIKGFMEDISVIDKRLSILNPEWNTYRDEIKALQKRHRIGLGLIKASSKALGVWKSAHVRLAEAVKEKKSFKIREVIAVGSDIQNLIKKWGEL